jgi:recombination protein RecA
MKQRRFPRLTKEKYKGVSDNVINAVVAKINKRFSKGRDANDDPALTTFSNSIFVKPKTYISSGIVPLDCIVCYGRGFPTGIIEIFGPEASSKTAILEKTLAAAQKKNYYTALFAQEYSADDDRAKAVGIDLDKLLVPDAETIEDVYDQLRAITLEIRKKDKHTPIVFGWDSIAATPTRTELEHKKGLAASDMGRFAAQMSKLFRRLIRFLRKQNVCLICINQIRATMAMWGPKESTYGGRALRFYAWVRIRTKQIKPIENKEGKVIGLMCEVTVVKNKVAPPLRKCLLPVYWTKGIDNIGACWEFATEIGAIERKGTSYRFHDRVVTKKSFPRIYKANRQEINIALKAAS